MVPERLLLRNFMCYRENLPELEFDGLHVACLSGDNGAGKSALLDAITWAIWGRARLASDDELIASGAQEMTVELQFGLNKQSYRIIRKRSRSKRGQSWLDFQVRNGEGWKALTEATLRETQQAIQSLLRIDYDTFINSAFLLQGRADEFTSRKKPAERKQVLAEILGLTVYDDLQQAAKKRASELERQIIGTQATIGELERRVEGQAKYAELLRDTSAKLLQVEAELEQQEALRAQVAGQRQLLSTQRDLLRAARQRQGEVEAERTRLVNDLVKTQERMNEAELLLARREEILEGIAHLANAEREEDALAQLLPRYEELSTRQRAAESQLAEDERVLQTELRLAQGRCDELRRKADERVETLNRIVNGEQLIAKLAPLREELVELRQQRDELGRQEAALRELEHQRRDVERRIELRRQSLVASREETQRTIREIERRLIDQPSWQKQYDAALRAAAEIEDLRQLLEQYRGEETEASEQIGALRAEAKRIEQEGREIAERLKLLDHDAASCPLCHSDLGHDGVERVRMRYDTERNALRDLLRDTRRQAQEGEAALKQLRTTLADLEERSTTLQHTAAQAASLENRLNEAAADRARLRDQQDTLESLLQQLDGQAFAAPEFEELEQIMARLTEAEESAALRARMVALDQRIGKLTQETTKFDHYQGKLEELREKIASLDAALVEQPVAIATSSEFERQLAEHDFGHEARNELARVQAALLALGYSRENHERTRRNARSLAHWRDDQQQLNEAIVRLEELRTRQERDQESLERCKVVLDDLAQQIGMLAASTQRLAEVERSEQELEHTIAELRRKRDIVLSDHTRYRQQLDDAELAAEQLVGVRAKQQEVCTRQELFEELSQCFGKKGVQAMLIETAIPEIEDEANRLLARMTDNQMHLTFETQRDTKKGDTVETLEIKIADALGTRAYEAFSGGEAFRVNFAVRVALARLLARRTGASLETLVIDEGFGTQDARGRERLVDAITSVQNDFRRILVVTHIQELKDLFPAQIEITKTEDGSVWAIS